jgi:organic radical activating enzyme
MNHCSWKCSYCHEIIHNGSAPYPDIKDCFRFIDSLVDHIKPNNQQANINFTGGEVTEWNAFPDIINHCFQKGCFVKIRSNANIDIDTWKYLIARANSVQLELHPEHTLISKFLICLAAAVEQGIEVSVTANMTLDHWQKLEDVCLKIANKYPRVNINKRMLFEDPIKNTTPLEYSETQTEEFKNQVFDLEFIDEHGKISHSNYQSMVLEDKNKFQNWNCSAGLEQIVVDAWGTIYRGHCRMGGVIGNLTQETIQWPKNSTVCRKHYCANNFDILATKFS